MKKITVQDRVKSAFMTAPLKEARQLLTFASQIVEIRESVAGVAPVKKERKKRTASAPVGEDQTK